LENEGGPKGLPFGGAVVLDDNMSSAHARLKAATAAAHERVERHARIVERLGDRLQQGALLSGFYALHAQVEAAAAPWLADHPGLDFVARRRTPLLEEGLAQLGVTPPEIGDALTAGSPAEALGLLYVVEGATLGGKVIRKSLAASGGDPAEFDFLDPYGEATGSRWRAFLAVLDEVADPDVDDAVGGALRGFRLAEEHLCGGAAR
jgi:heme oxygenase (biliverdin-IX-beta and delta-forming)